MMKFSVVLEKPRDKSVLRRREEVIKWVVESYSEVKCQENW